MPTFTAIALDRLIDPGATTISPSNGSDTNTTLDRRNSTPSRMTTEDTSSQPRRRPSILPPRSRLGKQESLPSPVTTNPPPSSERRNPPQWPQISPALYTTPETTPVLPDSPTSPSPYIINHKRRGPRLQLQKSSSEAIPLTKNLLDAKNGHPSDTEPPTSVTKSESEAVVDSKSELNQFHEDISDIKVNGSGNGVVGEENGVHSKAELITSPKLVDRESDVDDFYDPNDSMSFGSFTDVEDFSGERSGRTTTSIGEFYDAYEELSSDSGYQSQSSRYNIESELRETRLSLIMEIEKRKQAEETLNSMKNQWQVLRQKLNEVGLVLPPPIGEAGAGMAADTEEIYQQVNIARIVSESIGRGVARAELEEEMEAELEVKQFEIARLCDRLHYYETMNREMTQRNQEAIEMARRDRQRRNRIQKWIWGSVGVSITIGTAALVWTYIPSSSSKGASSASSSNHASEYGSQSKT